MTHGAKDIADSFRTVRRNTIQVAQDIPRGAWVQGRGRRHVGGRDAGPPGLLHALAQQLHFVEKKHAVSYEDFGRYMAEGKAKAETLVTKADIVAALETGGHDFACRLEQMSDEELAERVAFPEPIQPPTKTRLEMLLSVKEHEMHHRGQLMLIERLLGIVPHLTRARQSR